MTRLQKEHIDRLNRSMFRGMFTVAPYGCGKLLLTFAHNNSRVIMGHRGGLARG